MSDPRDADVFLDRFDRHARAAVRVVDPVTGQAFEVGADLQLQTFKRAFGDAVQLTLTAGPIWSRKRMVLAAICLDRDGIRNEGERARPATDVLRQIAGPNGLDCQDGVTYAVGVFASCGWPDDWRVQAHGTSRTRFYLVERGTSTTWRVFPEDELGRVFNAESADEAAARVARHLDTAFVVPGDVLKLDDLTAQLGVSHEAVERVVAGSGGRLRVIEHRGKSAVQRTSA